MCLFLVSVVWPISCSSTNLFYLSALASFSKCVQKLAFFEHFVLFRQKMVEKIFINRLCSFQLSLSETTLQTATFVIQQQQQQQQQQQRATTMATRKCKAGALSIAIATTDAP